MAHLVGDLLGLDAVGTWGGERGRGGEGEGDSRLTSAPNIGVGGWTSGGEEERGYPRGEIGPCGPERISASEFVGFLRASIFRRYSQIPCRYSQIILR